MTDQTNVQTEENVAHARFYLIFDEMARLGVEENALAEEIDEIERISRMIEDTSEQEPAQFMTTT